MCRVKICGLCCLGDIEAVNSALPDYVGFVFAPSTRQIATDTAALLTEQLDRRIRAVGVFVNEEIDVITAIYQHGIIDMVQLHGDESDSYMRQLRERCAEPPLLSSAMQKDRDSLPTKLRRDAASCRPPFQIIKAVGIGTTMPPLPLEPDYLLFDSLSSQRGGTGKSFDWNIIKGYHGLPYFVAGGLTIDTVQDVIALLAPFCVDVSSGVAAEGTHPSNPKKDTERIREFIRRVREVPK